MQPGAGPDVLTGGTPDDAPRRRWPTWIALLLLGGGALLITRPDVSLGGDPPPRPVQPSPEEMRNTLRGVDWPTRGDLAGDDRFLSAALDRIRQDRSEASRVYFAGRLSDGSRLVLAGSDVRRGVVASSVHALLVPAGAPLSGARVTEATALTDPQQVLAWAARGQDGIVRAVVLTRPGPVRFEVSARVEFSPVDGTPRRKWQPAAQSDGVAVADLGRHTDPIVTVRGVGPGVFRLPIVVRVAPEDGEPVVISGASGPGYQGPDGLNLTRALRAQAGHVVDLGEAGIRVLWSGAPWQQRRLALMLLTRADGQRFQALVGEQNGSAFPAGVRALAPDAPDRLPWLLEPFSPDDPTLLICPTGDGAVIYRRAGDPVRTLRIGADGVVGLVAPGPTAPSASGTEVTVLDRAGRILIRTVLPAPGFDDPLALD